MEDVDWFNRVSATAAVVTIFSPLPAASVARIFNRGSEDRLEPLLRPSRRLAISEVERTHRILIEPTVNHRGRVGVMRRLINALLFARRLRLSPPGHMSARSAAATST